MLPVKLVRSLVFGEPITTTTTTTNSSDDDDANCNVVLIPKPRRTPLLLFLPTRELVTDTYRLASIARDVGFDLHPTSSLSHIILTLPPHPPPLALSPSTASFPSTWSSTSLSSTSSLPEDTIPLPFPSLIGAPVPRLRAFVKLSRGLFKLVFAPAELFSGGGAAESHHWDCCSAALFSRLAGDRIGTMEGFSRALAGAGWSLFKTKVSALSESGDRRGCGGGKSVYLFRKVDVNRVRAGECRIRELRLPALDFRNAPLRILQYILLMTDDIFYLA
ncbi:uncharacterized protein LOC126800246 [Argentina anserina]|uniref:uncharacterized protein LOC126800246 n=1 Tax=Argentina anserina TaxID=57926 RepID=UPI0021768FAE|nr:uncharacterized protein LOC126800246 [Potentilla anserina]